MSLKTEQEIDAEKADYVAKPALDVVPAELPLAAGRALGYGKAKHGIATEDGWGTWRVSGTQQAEPLTHYACLMRHMLQWRAGEERDPESGLSHLDHAAAQLAILLDLQERPVGGAIEGQSPRDPDKDEGQSPRDPDKDEDWPLPEGWRWDNVFGWTAEGPDGAIGCAGYPECRQCRREAAREPEVFDIVGERRRAAGQL